MNEFEIIGYLKKLSKNNLGSLNLNDDIFFDKKNRIAISTDTYNEGIHFINFKKPDLVIRKVIRSSISDLICKGIFPKYYFISASFKQKDLDKKKIKLIVKTLRSEQKKYGILISGGDTTLASKTSFTITSLGLSDSIVSRNNVKLNDDIYVTGNIGDSFVGLGYLKKKFSNKKFKGYFIDKYYSPNIPISFCPGIKKFANSSIDVSDGLIEDMIKLINKQKYNFIIHLNKIPISSKLNFFIKKNNLIKEKILFHGDDYQTIFTAPKSCRISIKNYSKKVNQKITLIGKIVRYTGKNILLKNKKAINAINIKGYTHIL